MSISPLAGKPAPASMLIDVASLDREYHERKPDLGDPNQLVSFGTSGHRGTPLDGSFTEAHILAITQAICEYRASKGIDGPLFLGKDTHAVSGPAQRTALEVLAANGVDGLHPGRRRRTRRRRSSRMPSSLITRIGREHLADGIVITPSHNPPADGGFKYNPPNGGPADTDVTGWIQDRANALLKAGNAGVKRVPVRDRHQASTTTKPYDYRHALRPRPGKRHRHGRDPCRRGEASASTRWAERRRRYWAPIARTLWPGHHGRQPRRRSDFRFMTVDHDGKIRMDCSSPYAMASLVKLKDDFDVAFGNDPDSDRHGIVTPSAGLMNPNHYLAVAIRYLLTHRPGWPAQLGGRQDAGQQQPDRPRRRGSLAANSCEVPVGFKWFAPGLFDGSFCFGGEESAGASFLRQDGTVWTTDKDGPIMDLLAAEITARTGKDPGQHYQELTAKFGTPLYTRIDAPATPEQKKRA